MNRLFYTLLTLAFPILTLAQTAKMGEINQNEIDLKAVSYEPGAGAVFLVASAESRFFSSILETQYFYRKKILTETGKRNADIYIKYYTGSTNVELVSGIKAQITNYEGTAPVVTVLGKESIFLVDLGSGYKEYRISFPNVQMGSILEYSYKKADKNIEFLDGWSFQRDVPVIFSKYQITMIPQLEYKMIGQGENFFHRSEKSDANGTYSWVLRNLYSLKAEPYMKNYRDYVDRVEFQLSRYQRAATTSGPEWTDFLTTWEMLGDKMIEYYSTKGFYRSNPLEREVLSLDLSKGTQKEKAELAYYYIRDNFINEGEDRIYTNQTLPQLLKSKKGEPGELILAYMGILKSQGIECNPILIGSKGYGRSDIVPFPFLNQFDEILLLANLDGELQFLDLSDPHAPFGYVDLDKHVKAGLLIEKKASKLIPIDIRHNSNKLVFSTIKLDQETGELVIDNTIRDYFYEALASVHQIEFLKKQNKPLEELFNENYDAFEIRNVKVDNQLEEKNMVNISFQSILKGAVDHDLIIFNPLQFSDFSKNPFTQDFRVFPVDFEYAFNETYTANLIIPEGYELDDYPTDESITIAGSPISFNYQTENLGSIFKITARIEVKKPLIHPNSFSDLKFFMESVASKLAAPVVLKKVSGP
ncbi:DUF3857 domain-containing protein [Algoriphagus sp.]|uniref:DUF3857 domain-containing protein n=1 Tax=Algoriphagus sp. TaxID=1872435 RepID=UPI002715C882|nr:DUF3857 domain-containing protein [Algoriphagus sp.]MDO8967699.1 DUF3857 domain-containing protein [Algoriphagus sp.]MDP3199983.1 DUF3857 domain-containing protein [Algoriphagus sp.]